VAVTGARTLKFFMETSDDQSGIATPEPGWRRLLIFSTAIVIVLALLTMIHTLPIPDSTRLYRVLADFGHALIFAAIAFASLQVSWATCRVRPGRPARRDYAAAVLTVFILAIASELAQMSDPGRSASVLDVLRDVAGGALSLAYCAVHYESRETIKKPRRRMLAVISITIIAFLIAPIALTIAAYINRDAKWPTILSMDTRLDRVLLHPFEAQIRPVILPVSGHDNKDETGLLIASNEFINSGITVEDLGSDWRGFDRICADIKNLDGTSVEARILIGNAPNIFISTATHDVSMSLPAQSRLTSCHPLYAQAEYVAGDHPDIAGYGSLSLLAQPVGTVQEFIVYRLWLE